MKARVLQLPKRMGAEMALTRSSVARVSREIRYEAIGEAFLRVRYHHPEVTDPHEEFALALQIALDSLYAAAKELAANPPVLAAEISERS